MDVHHRAWLAAHPDRDTVWLSERLGDGFDVHHVDGDCTNNALENLVLIEHQDHMTLHGSTASRLERVHTRAVTNERLAEIDPDYRIGLSILNHRKRPGVHVYEVKSAETGLPQRVLRRLKERARKFALT